MSPIARVALAGLAVLSTAAFESGERVFAPGADLWERWEAHDPASTQEIDHGVWTQILQDHLITDGSGLARFDYGGMDAQENALLDQYLADMAARAISTYNRDEQYAYWLNLYNALTIDVVLDHYPVKSIKDIDISPGFFSSGPWGADVIAVEGTSLTLNDIEHRILRPIWKDPRIHYGVNCASIGCPNLLSEAFTSANLDQALDSAAQDYVNNPRGVSITKNQITVSRIYDWFIEDFGNNEQGILNHLKQHAAPELRAALERIGSLHSTQYDWALNDIK